MGRNFVNRQKKFENKGQKFMNKEFYMQRALITQYRK